MKIFSLLALGLVISLSAMSARELSAPAQTEVFSFDVDQKLEITSHMISRKNEARMIRTIR